MEKYDDIIQTEIQAAEGRDEPFHIVSEINV